MDTLQIQDAFQPYYADRSPRLDGDVADCVTARLREPGDRRAEMLRRLEHCRARLARAIAAEAERH